MLGAPFIPNEMLDPIPWYTVPVLGTGMLGVGTIYWCVWAKLLPAMGYRILHEVEVLPDGSERVRYVVSMLSYFHHPDTPFLKSPSDKLIFYSTS